MKLVLLCADFPFGSGGDNNFLQNEMNALSHAFDQVSVISTGIGELRRDLPENFKAIQIPVKFRPSKAIQAFFSSFNKESQKAKREFSVLYKNQSKHKRFKQIYKYNYMFHLLKKTIRQEARNADLVYSYWCSSREFAAAKLKAIGKIACPIVTRMHRFDLYLENNDCLPFREFSLENVSDIFFISKHGCNYYKKHILPLIDNEPYLHVSYLGLNKDALPKEYKGSSVLRIASCSNIIDVKRLDILVDALGEIKDIPIEWVHFGGGALEDKIKARAAEKLGDNVSYTFLGSCTNGTIQEYYDTHEIDIFVNCSDSEGVPVSIMEAISYGIPVICRNVGGNGEINIGNNGMFLLDENAAAHEFSMALRSFNALSYTEKVEKRNEMYNIFQENFSKENINNFADRLKSIAQNK